MHSLAAASSCLRSGSPDELAHGLGTFCDGGADSERAARKLSWYPEVLQHFADCVGADGPRSDWLWLWRRPQAEFSVNLVPHQGQKAARTVVEPVTLQFRRLEARVELWKVSCANGLSELSRATHPRVDGQVGESRVD